MRNEAAAKAPKVSQQEIATPFPCNSLTKKRKLSYTQKLTYAATLTAVALILKLISQMLSGVLVVANLKLSFIYIPWILAGVTLGPFYGMAVAFTTDALGTFLLPSAGSVMPLILLSNTLFPLFVWLAVRLLPFRSLFLKTVLGTCVSCLVCTLGLTTWGLTFLSGVPYFVLLATRVPQIAILALNLVAVGLLLPLLKKLRLVDGDGAKS